MSKYTLELRYLYEDKNFNLFDFPYNLYNKYLTSEEVNTLLV